MAGTITLTGYSDSDKVPGAYAEVIFGTGAINLRSLTMILLICGLKSSSGTITPDVDVVDLPTVDVCNTQYGQGSEGARMGRAALREIATGYRLMGCSATGTGAAATCTVTFATAASSAGYWNHFVGGTKIETLVASGDTATVQGDSFVAACNKLPDLPFTASNASGTVTCTLKHAGIRGNQWIIYQDKTYKPGATTCTLTGGSAVTSTANVNGIFFSGGSGVETMTTMLAALMAGRYHRIAPAQNDATSLAAWASQINTKAGPLEGRSEHVVVATNGTSGAAISLAQTTLNNARFQLCTSFENETHPSEIAAAMAAKRASREQTTPNSGYDGYQFITVQPQRFPGQVPARATLQLQLEAGVTPICGNVVATCIRAITTHCLNGTTPDFRTIDVSHSVVPDFMAELFKARWTSQFVVANPNVAPDPGTNDPPTPAGVATPALWNAEMLSIMLDEQTRGTITQVAANPPVSEFNTAAGAIRSRAPIIPTPIQHAIGIRVEQVNVAA